MAKLSDLTLSKRWFTIPDNAKNHQEINRLKQDLLSHKYTNYIIVAGRRSYKTETIKRFVCNQVMSRSDIRAFVGAPTTSQTKRVFWNDFNKLIPKVFVKKVSIQDLTITLINDSEIVLFSGETAHRIEGIPGDIVVTDESCFLDESAYLNSIEPIINDNLHKGAMFIALSRPLKKNHLYKWYKYGQDTKMSRWMSYHWSAEDILSAEQIANAKMNLDKATYSMQYLASFDTASSTPFYAYSEENNAPILYDKTLPYLIVTSDFNATEKYMSWIIGQQRGDVTEWFDIVYQPYTNTEEACKILQEKLHRLNFDKKKQIHWYGDFSSTKQTSNSSASDWQIIERMFSSYMIDIRIKPMRNVRDGVSAVNSRWRNANGDIRMLVNADTCEPLTIDMAEVEWDTKGTNLTQNAERGQLSDALIYFCDYEYPIIGQNKTTVA